MLHPICQLDMHDADFHRVQEVLVEGEEPIHAE